MSEQVLWEYLIFPNLPKIVCDFPLFFLNAETIIRSCKKEIFDSSSRLDELFSSVNELGTVRRRLEKSNNFFLSSILMIAQKMLYFPIQNIIKPKRWDEIFCLIIFTNYINLFNIFSWPWNKINFLFLNQSIK